MHFEITASLQALGKQLTPAQRNSSLFAESPRIGATTLRRGQVLKFNESQMKQHEVILKRLFEAGAIEIVQVSGKERIPLREAMAKNKAVLADVRQEMKKVEKEEKVEKKAEMPPPPPPPEPAPEPAPEPTPEPVPEAPVEAKEEPKAEEPVEAPKEEEKAPEALPEPSKGKRGRRG